MRNNEIESYKATQRKADDIERKIMPSLLTPNKQPGNTNCGNTTTENAFGSNGINGPPKLNGSPIREDQRQINKIANGHRVCIDMLKEKSKPPKKRLASYYAGINHLKNGITGNQNQSDHYNNSSDHTHKFDEEISKHPISTVKGNLKKPQISNDNTLHNPSSSSEEVAPISMPTTSTPSIDIFGKVTSLVETIDQVTFDPYSFDAETDGPQILFALCSKNQKKKRRLWDTYGNTKKHSLPTERVDNSGFTQFKESLLPTSVSESLKPVTVVTSISKSFKPVTIATTNVKSLVVDGDPSVRSSDVDKKGFFRVDSSNSPAVEVSVNSNTHTHFDSRRDSDDELMPKIVSYYSLKPIQKKSKKEKVKKYSKKRKRDQAKLSNKALVSGDKTRPRVSSAQTRITTDPNSLIPCVVKNGSANVNPPLIANNSHSSSPSSSLESWFKSAQGSVLEMHVVQSDPMSNDSPKQFDSKTSHSEAFVGFFPNPLTTTDDTSHNSEPKYDQLCLKSQDVHPVSEVDDAEDIKNEESYAKSTRNLSHPSTTSHDALSISDENFENHDIGLNMAVASDSSCINSNSSARNSNTSEALKNVGNTRRRHSNKPLDYSNNTLKKTYKSKKKVQTNPLDLSSLKGSQSPLDLEKAFDEQLAMHIVKENSQNLVPDDVPASIIQAGPKMNKFTTLDQFDKRRLIVHTVRQEERREQQNDDITTVVSDKSSRDKTKDASYISLLDKETRGDNMECETIPGPTSTVKNLTDVENETDYDSSDDSTENTKRDAGPFVDTKGSSNASREEETEDDGKKTVNDRLISLSVKNLKELENYPKNDAFEVNVRMSPFKYSKEMEGKQTHSRQNIAIKNLNPYVLLKRIPTTEYYQPQKFVAQNIGFKPRLSLDFLEMEEACCDEYDNMHFNEEVEEDEEEMSGLKDKESFNEANEDSRNIVIHAGQKSQKARTVQSTVSSNNKKSPLRQTDNITKENRIVHSYQPVGSKKSTAAKKKGFHKHGNIPIIKERDEATTSPLKQRNLFKLGHNVHNGVKLPEIAKKRRRLVAKDIKRVRNLPSHSDDSSEESDELFKTTKLKAKYSSQDREGHIIENGEDSEEIFKTMKMKNKHINKDEESHNMDNFRITNASLSQGCSPTNRLKRRTKFPVSTALKSTTAIAHSDLSETLSNIVNKDSLKTTSAPSHDVNSGDFFKSTTYRPISTTSKHTTSISDSDLDVSLIDIANKTISSKAFGSLTQSSRGKCNKKVFNKNGTRTNGKSGRRVRMGTWMVKSLPVITKLPNQPLYHKSFRQRRDFYQNMCLAMKELHRLKAFHGQESEAEAPNRGATDSTSQASLNKNTARIYAKGDFDLKPCFVRLERLTI